MAPSFLGSANKALQNYYTPILIIILLALFGYLSYLFYNQFLKKKEIADNSDDIANKQGANTVSVSLKLYYVDWCPHSNAIMSEWNMFKEEYNNKNTNGYKHLYLRLEVLVNFLYLQVSLEVLVEFLNSHQSFQ